MSRRLARPGRLGRPGAPRVVTVAVALGVVVAMVGLSACSSGSKAESASTSVGVTTGTPLPGATAAALAELQTAAVKTRAVQSLTALRPNNPPFSLCPTCTSYTERYSSPDRFQIDSVDPSGVKASEVQVGSSVWQSINGGPLIYKQSITRSAEDERHSLFRVVDGIDSAVSATKNGTQFMWSDAANMVWPVTVENGYITVIQGVGGPPDTVTYRDFNNTPPIVVPG